MKRSAVVVCMLLLSASTAASADTIAGRASVIDGDTIEIHGERIRILDIDAPESQQACQDGNGVDWRCGQKASLALSDWIGTRSVSCETTGKDIYKRWLARCSVGGTDLAEWMASQGWVVPYRDCKCEVVRAAAKTAKSARAGIWAGTFEMPWDWRHGERSSASDAIEPSPSSRDQVTGAGIGDTMIYATDILLGGIGAGLVIVLYQLFKILHAKPRRGRSEVEHHFRRRRWSRLLSRSVVPALILLVSAGFYLWPQARGMLNFAPLTSGSCNIKGNISLNNGDHIYHMPGGKWYDQTRIDPSKGERWFCSEAEARAAGWRPAIEW